MIPWGLPDFVPLQRIAGEQVDLVARASTDGWWDWEDPLPVALAALAPQFPGAFYDVGANTGFYSILLARLDTRRTVRAFEPVPRLADSCRSNLALAGLGQVTVEELALSDSAGTTPLYIPPSELGMVETKASLQRSFNSEVAETITVQCETLDTVVRRLGDAPLGMAKVDVEGAEHLVLAGARETMARDRPLLSVELLADAEFDTVAQLLAELNYRSLTLRPGLDVEVASELVYHDDGWNHLLLPAEAVPDCLQTLTDAAEEFRSVRARLTHTTLDDYLAVAAAELPSEMLAAQLAIHARAGSAAEADNAALRQRNAALARELHAVTNSASWQLTAPVRALRQRLRDRRR